MNFLVLFLFSAFGAHAGSEMGNGADNFTGDYGAAWFLGQDHLVTYCMNLDPAFGRPHDQINADILAAWNQWLSYAQSHGAYVLHQEPAWKFPTQIKEVPCTGQEDLRFWFGTENQDIKTEKLKYEKPSAISTRTQFDDGAGWGKGWIWFCMPNAIDPNAGFPDWGRDLQFRSILLHEIGHVFGNQHVTGTIMDHGLSQKLYNGNLRRQFSLRIDQSKQILGAGFQGNIPGVLGSSGYFNLIRAFEWLTGKAPAGTVSAKLASGATPADLTLSVTDGTGTRTFALAVPLGSNGPSYTSDQPVFKMMRDQAPVYLLNRGTVLFGSIHHPVYGDVVALFEENMSSTDDEGPYSIKVLISGLPQPLFHGFPQY